MKKRFLAVIMAMAMITNVSTVGFAAESDEKVELTWLGYYTSNITVAEDSQTEKLIEETFNVDITPITDVNAENMETYVASGDVLNVTCFTKYLYGDYQYLYEQGLIRSIPDEWLWEYYPTGMEILKEMTSEEFVNNGEYKVNDEVLYTPWIEGRGFTPGIMVYRKDWLDKLGLKEPTTLDEFHDMLYAFTYDDPDGNGVDDTYGMSFFTNFSSYQQLFPLMGAFGLSVPNQFHVQEDGTVIYDGAQEGYKTVLSIMKEWIDEGIIDPESVTDDRNAVRTKWTDNKLGAMGDTEAWIYSWRGASSILGLVEESQGEGAVELLGALTSEYGDGKIYSPSSYPSALGQASLFFTSSATDEQVIAVLKILEGLASNYELFIKVLYGEEGVDYSMNGEQLAVNADMSVEQKAEKGLDWSFYGAAAQDEYMRNITYSERDFALMEKIATWPTMYAKNFANFSTEAADLYLEEVKKVTDEYYANILLGNDNLEEGWDNYLANLSAAGLDEIISSYEEALK